MIVVLVLLAGLLLGSLLNIIIIRLPREQNLLGWPRCTRTGELLAWWQLLPVIGWLLQRGRARNGKLLHWIYPFIELLTATVATLLYLTYGFSITFFYLVFVCVVLIVTGAIDWLHRWIYTFVILGSVPLVILLGLPVEQISLANAGIGALVAGFGFVLFYMLARVLFPGKSAPFGLGDVYLGIFIGAAVGLTRLGESLWYGILMAGIVSAFIVFAKYVLRRSDVPEYIAYGTYLCLGTIFFLLFRGF